MEPSPFHLSPITGSHTVTENKSSFRDGGSQTDIGGGKSFK